jgi:ParB-like nuclease domain
MTRMAVAAVKKAMHREDDSPFVVPETVLSDVARLNPAPYNPRKMSPLKFDGLKQGILKNGFLINLVVQRSSPKYGEMVIVGGHQRIRAVREICIEANKPMPRLPSIVLDLDDRKAKLLNIALNNVDGEFDAKLLGEMLEDIQHEQPFVTEDRILIGMDQDDLGKYLHLSDPPPIIDGQEPIIGTTTLRLEFRNRKTRDAVKEKLEERAKVGKKSTGDVVFDILSSSRKK